MNKRIVQLVLALIFLFSQTALAPAGDLDNRFNEIVSRLYLNHRSLSVVYNKLHDAALDAVNGSDQQLAAIQKTYLFVSEANLVCLSQWELLSIIGYIKDSHLADYYTLRVKGLDRAAFESRDRLISLKLYSADIENPEPRELIEEAVGLIEANIYMFEQLADILKPLANPPNPFTRSLKNS